jgi:O-antigen/teichoic acid export membrane protein
MGALTSMRRAIWVRVITSRFLRDAAWVAGANGVAQGIIAIAAPFLTRLYTPTELGSAALFIGLVQIASPFIDGRLSIVIPLPKEDVEAVHIALACLALILITCILGQALVVIFSTELVSRWGQEVLSHWLWLLPSTLAMSSIYQTLRMWGLRRKDFGSVAGGTVCRAVVNATWPILFVLARPSWIPPEAGLLLAPFIADAIGNSWLSFRLRFDWTFLKQASLSRTRQVLRSFGKTIVALFCSQALNAVYGQIPLLAIGLFFGPAQAAMYALAERFSSVPTQIVGRAFGDVYRQRAVPLWHAGESLYPLAIRSMLFLVLIGAVPYATAVSFAPSAFALVFGEAWRDAGVLASLLLVASFIQFVLAGIDWTAAIVGASRYMLGWHVVRGAWHVAIVFLQYYFDLGVAEVVTMFSVGNALLWLVDIVVALWMAKRWKV